MKAAAIFSLTGRVALVTGAPAGSVSSLPAQHEASSFDSLRIVEVFSRKMDVINERGSMGQEYLPTGISLLLPWSFEQDHGRD
jgi:hypothetical protein